MWLVGIGPGPSLAAHGQDQEADDQHAAQDQGWIEEQAAQSTVGHMQGGSLFDLSVGSGHGAAPSRGGRGASARQQMAKVGEQFGHLPQTVSKERLKSALVPAQLPTPGPAQFGVEQREEPVQALIDDQEEEP
jgi:hypothetical protein